MAHQAQYIKMERGYHQGYSVFLLFKKLNTRLLAMVLPGSVIIVMPRPPPLQSAIKPKIITAI